MTVKIINTQNNHKTTHKKHYFLLIIWNSVEPEIHGPYNSINERNIIAKRIKAGDCGDDIDVFPIDICNNHPICNSYPSQFFD